MFRVSERSALLGNTTTEKERQENNSLNKENNNDNSNIELSVINEKDKTNKKNVSRYFMVDNETEFPVHYKNQELQTSDWIPTLS